MQDTERIILGNASDFALIVFVFRLERMTKFLDNFQKFNPGTGFDLYIVHNCFNVESIINRYERPLSEVNKINTILTSLNLPYRTNILIRPNIGEDLGAYRHMWNLLKGKYKNYFFLNEAGLPQQDSWLLPFEEALNMPRVGAVTPTICKGTRYPWCMPMVGG